MGIDSQTQPSASFLISQAISGILPCKPSQKGYPSGKTGYAFVSMGEFDARTRQWSVPLMAPDDFGDYLIFVLRFAQRYQQPEIEAWVLEQFDFTRQHLVSKEGFYCNWRMDRPLPKHSFWKVHRLYEHMDLVLGWNQLYRLTQDPKHLDSSQALANALIRFGQNRAGYFYDSFWSKAKLPLNKLIKPEINGIFAEEFVILFEFTQKEIYLESARAALRYFFRHPVFQQRGLLPDGFLPYWMKPWKTDARFMKTQTNMIYAALRFYESTQEQEFADYARHACLSIAKYQEEGGAFPHKIDVISGAVSVPEVLLTQNFALVDIFLQAHLVLRDVEFGKIAQKCANWWLQYQSPLGLIPESPLKKRTNKMDQNSDFSVSLMKLSEAFSRSDYLQKAEEILKGLTQYHRVDANSAESSFAKSVDVDTGTITNYINETKYLGGFLKALLALEERQQGRSLLFESLNRDFFRDR